MVRTSCPVFAFQSFSVLSRLAEMTYSPLGERPAEAVASLTGFARFPKLRRTWPVTLSRSLRISSSLMDRIRAPSGENATDQTLDECSAGNVLRSWPVAVSHSFTV